MDPQPGWHETAFWELYEVIEYAEFNELEWAVGLDIISDGRWQGHTDYFDKPEGRQSQVALKKRS